MQPLSNDQDPNERTHDWTNAASAPEATESDATGWKSSSERSAHVNQPRNKARLALAGTVALTVLVCVATIIFMSMHPHPVDEGKVRGPGDEAAPNAPRDYKYR